MHIRFYVKCQSESFFTGFGLQNFYDRSDAADKIKGFDFQFQFSGFDFGEIQNIADHGQQNFGRISRCFGIVALLSVQFRIQQQPSHVYESIHRGADFMAHICQKFTFGFIGCLGSFFGLPEFDILCLQALPGFAQCQMGPNACQHFPILYRFGDIVNTSGFKSSDFVGCLIQSTDKNNRDIAGTFIGFQIFADLEAGHIRHHNIQQNNIRVLFLRCGYPYMSVRRGQHPISRFGQNVGK